MAPTNRVAAIIRFGVFEVDLRTGELRKSGVRIKLQEQPFKVLASLSEHPGEMVTREELRRIWPDEEFGDFDHAVNLAVAKLRAALGDSAEMPRIIETLPRRGYRLIMSVRVDNPGAHPGAQSSSSAEPVSFSAESSSAIPSVPGVAGLSRGSRAFSIGRKWGPLIVILALIAVTTTLLVFRWCPRRRIPNLQHAEIAKLTDSGAAAYAAISLDGRYVVYALRSGEKLSLRVRQVATSSDIEVLPPDTVDFQGLSFSPDSNYVYFVRSDPNLPIYKSLHRMPVLGGPARLLIKDVDCAASFSPDGREFVFTRGTPSRNVTEVLIANADGTGEHVLVAIPDGDPSYNPGATWSADGRTIAVSEYVYGKKLRFILYLVSVKDGARAVKAFPHV